VRYGKTAVAFPAAAHPAAVVPGSLGNTPALIACNRAARRKGRR